MEFQARLNQVAVKTIGLNVQIIKDSNDLNNIRYLVVCVAAYNKKNLRANCGNFADALALAQSC